MADEAGAAAERLFGPQDAGAEETSADGSTMPEGYVEKYRTPPRATQPSTPPISPRGTGSSIASSPA